MTPTSTDVTVDVKAKLPVKAAVAFLADDAGTLAGAAGVPDALREAAERLLADGTARGKAGEAASGTVDGRRIILLGVGDFGSTEKLRNAGAALARQAKRYQLAQVAIVPPEAEVERAVEALVLGFCLGAFEYREYRGAAAKQKEAEALGKVKLTVLADGKSAKDAATRAEGIAFGQNYARTIASRPGNDINPPSLAKEAMRIAKELGLTCKVLDEKQAQKLGMGGLLAVGAGSGTPPRMIVLEYGLGGASERRKRGKAATRNAAQAPLLVVGKAITFDTGGISIKPAQNMGEMIFDKCGGMAVLGLMAAVARLGKAHVNRPVVGILAAAENMPGPTAYRPGDILRMYNGVTVEVTNTDAEGRLVLADALAWGIETYEPAACVNLATLTGACVVALGNSRAGAWCNNDDFWQRLQTASNAAGEKLWRMPLGDDYREMLKASSADLVNSPGRWGGCDTAAEFLHHFIPGNVDGTTEVPWCHLDIAGVADTDKDLPLYVRGATGFGVRTLVEWVTGE